VLLMRSLLLLAQIGNNPCANPVSKNDSELYCDLPQVRNPSLFSLTTRSWIELRLLPRGSRR
jgi:hypothetical protein